MVMQRLKTVYIFSNIEIYFIVQGLRQCGIVIGFFLCIIAVVRMGYCVSGRTAASIVYVTVNGSELRL
jgi:hypothetical protein